MDRFSREDLQRKVAEVARFLVPWTPKRGERVDRGAVLVHPNVPGAEVYFVGEGGRRIRVSGTFPRDFYPRYEVRPRITVSAERSAKSIASDVARRFLPRYTALYDEMEAQATAWAQCLEARNRALDELAAALGVRVSRHYEDRQDGQILHYGRDHARLVVTTSGGTEAVTVDLELSRLPFDVALRVCAVVKEVV